MLMGVACANFFSSVFDTIELTAYFWILSAIIVQYDTEIRAQARAADSSGKHLQVAPWEKEPEEAR